MPQPAVCLLLGGFIGVKNSCIFRNTGSHGWINSLKVLRAWSFTCKPRVWGLSQRHHSQGFHFFHREFQSPQSCQNQASGKAFSFLLLMPCAWVRQATARSWGALTPEQHPRKQLSSAFESPALEPPAHMVSLESRSSLILLLFKKENC